MKFLIAPDRLDLAEAVRDYLAGTHGPEVLRKLDEGDNRDPEIWAGLVEMGLPGLLIPEAHGGLGLTLLDGALVARECGRYALGEPLVESAFVMAPWLVARGDTDQLKAMAAGEARPLPAHRINGWREADTATEATLLKSVDPLRNLAPLGDDASDDPHLFNLGALMSAAQLLGLAEAMLDQAVEYSKLREQFGQPIGGFQAVKHLLADVAGVLEFARPVVWRAAQALEDGLPSAPLHVSHAKLAAAKAGYQAAESAIQVHGAMGYTYEVDLHFWMKRTWALAGAWGSQGFHNDRIEQAILQAGDRVAHPIGPQHTFV